MRQRAPEPRIPVVDPLRGHPERNERGSEAEPSVRLPGRERPLEHLEHVRVARFNSRGRFRVLAPDSGAGVLGNRDQRFGGAQIHRGIIRFPKRLTGAAEPSGGV